MDALGIWLLILVVLPFLLFLFRIILMAWKSVLLSKRIKNLSREIEDTNWIPQSYLFPNCKSSSIVSQNSIKPAVTLQPPLAMATNISCNWTGPFPGPYDIPCSLYPSQPTPVDYSYDVYSYIIVVFVLLSILGLTKVAINRRNSAIRQANLRNARARQSQLPTISGSVDGISNASSDTPSTSQRTVDEHFKRDLPPTYDEVMKNFLNAKEAAASDSQHNATAALEVGTPNITEIDIEEPPPPQYSNIQS